jgi:hypothetical protein
MLIKDGHIIASSMSLQAIEKLIESELKK